MSSTLSNYYIIKILIKWKWHLLIILLVATALGVLFSSPLFITPKYCSTAVLYPANIITVSDESETEQMLEILQSTNIKLMVIEEDSLYSKENYNIDKNSPTYLSTVLTEYNNNVTISKTPNDAVKIVVYDKDPKVACKIVESIINSYNIYRHNLDLEKTADNYINYLNLINIFESDIQKTGKELSNMREKFGIIDRIQLEGNTTDKATIMNWAKYGAEYEHLDSLYNSMLSQRNKTNEILYNLKRDSKAVKKYCHIVESPFAADKKAKPQRTIIIIITAIAALFAGIVFATIYESIKTNNKE